MPPTPACPATDSRPPYGRDPRALHRVTAVLALTGCVLAGCGTPPELRAGPTGLPTLPATPSATAPAPSTPSPTAGSPGLATPTPTADPGLVAVACEGRPTQQRILDLVRGRAGLLPRDARVRVRTGPLCAADWQFTALDVTGYEPLQVVTRERADSLHLVAAGTDVCSIEVRVTGPPGIQKLACGDDVTGGAPPAPLPPSPTPTPTPTATAPAR
ncbi:hypothetical protein Jiend_29300 [Micromonospora endophytica]|nr:hypothetical protein [Micromonospora endophytica]BCJ59508.1 hypothetical protein Jiend_29300 [Micromonospora endophytica]